MFDVNHRMGMWIKLVSQVCQEISVGHDVGAAVDFRTFFLVASNAHPPLSPTSTGDSSLRQSCALRSTKRHRVQNGRFHQQLRFERSAQGHLVDAPIGCGPPDKKYEATRQVDVTHD